MTDAQPGAEEMTPLHPAYLTLLRIRALISAVILIALASAAALALGPFEPLPRAAPAGAAFLLGLFLVLFLPRRRYRAWGFREEEDELLIAGGIWVRTRIVIPYGRVQHIDIAQGPLERMLGLGTLIVHTAGTRGASVPLPGLAQEEAARLRDLIRGRIREDLR